MSDTKTSLRGPQDSCRCFARCRAPAALISRIYYRAVHGPMAATTGANGRAVYPASGAVRGRRSPRAPFHPCEEARTGGAPRNTSGGSAIDRAKLRVEVAVPAGPEDGQRWPGVPAAGASAGRPARERDDMGCPSAAEADAALLVAPVTVTAVCSCGCERERDREPSLTLPWPTRAERGPVSLRRGIDGAIGATGLEARVVGAAVGRRLVAKNGESGVEVGREPERSRAMSTLRSGRGLGGGSLILLPTCMPDGLERVRSRTVVLASRCRKLESPPSSSFFLSCVALEGEPSESPPSAGVKVTTGKSGTVPISSVLSFQKGLSEVEPPPAALAAPASTRVRDGRTVPDAAPSTPAENALGRGRNGSAHHVNAEGDARQLVVSKVVGTGKRNTSELCLGGPEDEGVRSLLATLRCPESANNGAIALSSLRSGGVAFPELRRLSDRHGGCWVVARGVKSCSAALEIGRNVESTGAALCVMGQEVGSGMEAS